jgi:CBS domain-containing protein
MKISSILSKKGGDVVSIGEEATVQNAIDVLVEHNIGAVVILNEVGELAGILSERDIIRAAAKTPDIFSVPVIDVMTSQVVVGLPEDDVISVAHIMTERRFRHLPIKGGDRLVGIVSIGDILKAQRDEYLGEIDTLETQLMADED